MEKKRKELKANELLCLLDYQSIVASMPHKNKIDIKVTCRHETIHEKYHEPIVLQKIDELPDLVGIMIDPFTIYYRKIKKIEKGKHLFCIQIKLLKNERWTFPEKNVYLSKTAWECIEF